MCDGPAHRRKAGPPPADRVPSGREPRRRECRTGGELSGAPCDAGNLQPAAASLRCSILRSVARAAASLFKR
jgi:hypothetical protein